MDLSKRGKVGDVYRSGSFKKAKKRGMKTADLNKAQLKRATTARGKKVSQKAVKRATAKRNETDISQTQFEKGKGVTKNGRLFTGTVKLASGKTATYVRGRRVVAGPKKKTGGGGGGGGTTSATARTVNAQGSRIADTTASRIGGYTPGAGMKSVAQQRKERALKRSSARSAGRTRYQNSGPKVGDIRTVTSYNTGRPRRERWDGTKWVTMKRFD